MIKVFFLICEPGVAWEKIAQARRSIAFITFVHLLPIILLSSAFEAWGLIRHGKYQPRFEVFKRFTPDAVLTFEVIQVALFLAAVLVAALLVFRLSQTFLERVSFPQALTTVAYGFSPIFLLHFADAGATIPPAGPWLLGVLLSVWILYQGVPRVMQPDPTHAFGLYLSTLIVVLLTSGLARLITAMYLLGYMDLQHSWFARHLSSLFPH